jgi:pyruvate dehydrogenase E2 component (dihydrolipoamide acetyltransferase)
VATEVTMPRLSDSMEEGTILRWLKSVGDEVHRGDELVEIETDKANMTYESLDDGVLVEVVAAEGDTLPIGEVIARIGSQDEMNGAGPARDEAPEKEAAGDRRRQTAQETGDGRRQPAEEETADGKSQTAEDETPDGRGQTAEEQTAEEQPAGDGRRAAELPDGRLKASPVARRMARELHVQLESLHGSGPGGRIVKADVEAAAGGRAEAQAPPSAVSRPPSAAPPSPEGAKGEVQIIEPSRLQQTVARRMAESKATVPHFYLETEIDMTEGVAVREQLKRIAGDERPAPTYNDMVVKACALALRDFPRANGSYRDGHFELYSRVNVGIAVAGLDALVVPTIFDADRRSLGEIAATARELAQKVRDGTITPPELSGGTFTVSNLGMYGVTNFSAVINPPQAALLSVGALQKKAAVDDSGRVVARPMMGVTLACDHRILYGADGAQFLARVRDLLEQPLSMAL